MQIQKWESWQWITFVAPLVVGMGTSRFYGSLKNAGKNIVGKPPEFMFGVIWSVLYLLLGASFNLTYNDEIDHEKKEWIVSIYTCTFILLSFWPLIYNKISKIYALWLLTLSLIFIMNCYSLSPWYSKMCLTPHIGWLILAGKFNFAIINK